MQEILMARNIILETYDLFKDSSGRVSTARMAAVATQLGEFAPLFHAIFSAEVMKAPQLR